MLAPKNKSVPSGAVRKETRQAPAVVQEKESLPAALFGNTKPVFGAMTLSSRHRQRRVGMGEVFADQKRGDKEAAGDEKGQKIQNLTSELRGMMDEVEIWRAKAEQQARENQQLAHSIFKKSLKNANRKVSKGQTQFVLPPSFFIQPPSFSPPSSSSTGAPSSSASSSTNPSHSEQLAIPVNTFPSSPSALAPLSPSKSSRSASMTSPLLPHSESSPSIAHQASSRAPAPPSSSSSSQPSFQPQSSSLDTTGGGLAPKKQKARRRSAYLEKAKSQAVMTHIKLKVPQRAESPPNLLSPRPSSSPRASPRQMLVSLSRDASGSNISASTPILSSPRSKPQSQEHQEQHTNDSPQEEEHTNDSPQEHQPRVESLQDNENGKTSSSSTTASAIPAPTKVEYDEKKMALRQHVAQEILQTERNYSNTLTTMVDHYLVPLRKLVGTPKEIVSKEDLRTVFYQLEVIRGINSLMLCQLEERISAWSPSQVIGDIFSLFSSAFKAYSVYINSYSAALALLQALRDGNPAFVKFCRRRKGEWLDSLMIQPVQRIPQYIMLLSSLLDATPRPHPDHPLVRKALDAVRLTAAQNHRAQLLLENFITLQSLEKRLGTKLTESHRQFLHASDVALWDLKKRKVRALTLFVFSDILLFAEAQGSDPALSPALSASPNPAPSSAHPAAGTSSTPLSALADKYRIVDSLNSIEILRILRERSILREVLPDHHNVTSSFARALRKVSDDSADSLSDLGGRKTFVLVTLFRPVILCSNEKDDIVSALNGAVAEATDNLRSRDAAH